MTSNKQSILPLLLIIFIDGMGLSILFPVLSGIVLDPHHSILAANTSLASRDFYYGLIIGIYMLCWFFGAAILGDISDMIGRKKALMICLVGTALSYILSSISITFSSLPLLLVGRVIAGLTAGSQAISQAAIVDMSTENTKARYIGYVLLSLSLGFILGPLIGGTLSDSRLVSWFGFTMPMNFSAVVACINIILLGFLFHEPAVTQRQISFRLLYPIEIIIQALKRSDIRKLSLVFLLMEFGWASFFSFFAPFMTQRFHSDATTVAYLLATMGIGFSIGCSVLVNLTEKRFPIARTVAVCLTITSIFLVCVTYSAIQAFVWPLVIMLGASMALAYTLIITLFSQRVGAEEQGWIMGVTGSIMALCFGLAAILAGLMGGASIFAPMLLSALLIFAAGVSLHYLYRKAY